MNHLLFRLIEPLKILILFGIAITLSLSAWFFYVGPTPLTTLKTNNIDFTNVTEEQIKLPEIASLNLFGNSATSTPRLPVVVAENLRKTTLNLELIGTFEAEDSDTFSVALIAEKNRPAKSYQLKDSLPGGAVIVEIHGDRIVLSRGNEREQLPFEQKKLLRPGKTNQSVLKSDLNTVRSPSDSGVISAMPNDSITQESGPDQSSMTIRRVVSNFEQKLAQNANQTLNSIGVEPVEQGTALGYKLGALAAHPTLRQTGLQAGDVLLSVNNRAVGDISADRLEISQVVALGSARLEVQRGDRRFFVTVSLQ